MDILYSLQKEREKAIKDSQKQPAVMDSATGVEYAAEDDASAYVVTDLRLKVVAAVMTWIETEEDDLDEGETLADRLDALMVGIVDIDKDGELDDEELEVLYMAYNALASYLEDKDVSEEDILLLVEEGDEDAADRIKELLVGILPSGDDEVADEINNFGFDLSSDESVMDAAYKRRIVIRGGKKKMIMKRVSGRVRRTSAQKRAVAKMLRKSHSGKAQMRRAKSMKKRAAMNLRTFAKGK